MKTAAEFNTETKKNIQTPERVQFYKKCILPHIEQKVKEGKFEVRFSEYSNFHGKPNDKDSYYYLYGEMSDFLSSLGFKMTTDSLRLEFKICW